MSAMPIIMAERKGRRAGGCLLQFLYCPSMDQVHHHSTGQRESHGQGQHQCSRELYIPPRASQQITGDKGRGEKERMKIPT